MTLAKHIYWLPTYLSREDPALEVLTPADLITSLTNKTDVTISEFDDALWENIQSHLEAGDTVLCMGAGAIDDWVRGRLAA